MVDLTRLPISTGVKGKNRGGSTRLRKATTMGDSCVNRGEKADCEEILYLIGKQSKWLVEGDEYTTSSIGYQTEGR